ncbi:hypothetical protein GCM10009612_75270 [Streptomyces beijiangensis]
MSTRRSSPCGTPSACRTAAAAAYHPTPCPASDGRIPGVRFRLDRTGIPYTSSAIPTQVTQTECTPPHNSLVNRETEGKVMDPKITTEMIKVSTKVWLRHTSRDFKIISAEGGE